MTETNRPLEVDDLTERPLGPPSAVPLDGKILVRSRVDFATDDRDVVSGVWECTPGASRWEFLSRGEIIHVVAGRMTVKRDDEGPVEVAAGTTAYFPIGWCGTWTVHETLRKVFVVFK